MEILFSVTTLLISSFNIKDIFKKCLFFNKINKINLYFSIGKYVDEILFDVVSLEASHLLLGTPWQYDRDVVHNGVTKKFSFVHKGKKVTLKPLSPSEVCENQIKMRVKREQERNMAYFAES